MRTGLNLPRRSPAWLTLAAFGANALLFSPGLRAEPAAPTVESAAPAPSPRARAVSPELAQKLALQAPKFVPPPAPGEKAPELPDRRELDKPKNGIVRLPNYVVREPKVPDFPERELRTPAGKLATAYKRHPGLRFGSLPFLSNDGIALSMLAEEDHLERMAELKELYGLLRAGGDARAKAQGQDAFLRKND
jgi:hypothetical protein